MIDEFNDVKIVWAAPVKFIKNRKNTLKYKIFSMYTEAVEYCQPPMLKMVTAVKNTIIQDLTDEIKVNLDKTLESLAKIQFVIEPVNDVKNKYLIRLFKYKYLYYIINDMENYNQVKNNNKILVDLIKNEIKKYYNP